MHQREFSLENKIALVTGSTGGIGREMARVFCASGAMVGINGRDGAVVSKVVTDLKEQKLKAFEAPFDVTKHDEVRGAIRDIYKTQGSIDILVNNAGRNDHRAPLEDIDEKGWRTMIDTFLTSVFFCTKEIVPYMKKRGWGRIINIGSDAAIVGLSKRSHYTAAKAGLIGLTRSLAREVGEHGITVNIISPGVIKTEGNAHLVTAEQERHITETNLIRRIGKPEDVAHLALFLCTDQAEFITGQVFHINGGVVM